MTEYDNLSFDELKSQLVEAIEEQKQIDAKLKGIKQAISVKLKEIEALRDSLDMGEKKGIVPSNLPIYTPFSSLGLKLEAVWQFVLAYIVPILIIAAIFFFAGKILKGKSVKATSNVPAIEYVVADTTGDYFYGV